MNGMSLEDFNYLGNGIASLATAIGILVGGGWILYRFRLNRDSYPRAEIAHQFAGCSSGHETLLVRVNVNIENVGAVPLQIGKMIIRLQQICPCDASILEGLANASKEREEGDWPILAQRSLFDPKCQVEPGEHELFCFDFVIPESVKVVTLYTHFENRKRPGHGWGYSTWKPLKDLQC